jgi:hypothetical protein
MVVEASLADLHQCKSALEADRTTAMERVEQQLPTFIRASQNVAVVATLWTHCLHPPPMGWARCTSD